MKLPRRKFLQFAGATAVVPTCLRVATAQTYPSRPITMIVPFPAGAAYDTIGRIIAERMKGALGQSVVIENVSGAGGSIGVGQAARASPDGYTIVVGGQSVHVLNGALYSLPYDVVNDFTPISPLVRSSLVLFSRKGFPANDLPELIDWLKAHPEMASAAIQIASVRLVTASFQKQTGTRFALVPYRGSAPAMQDLVAGHIDFFFDAPLQIPLVRAGNIKAFAVTNDVRLAVAPNIPTFAEMGLPGVSFSAWFGLFAPRGTPTDIIGKLNAAVVEALADPAARSRLVELGFEIFPRERQTPKALGALVKADAEKYWPLIKEFGIKAE